MVRACRSHLSIVLSAAELQERWPPFSRMMPYCGIGDRHRPDSAVERGGYRTLDWRRIVAIPERGILVVEVKSGAIESRPSVARRPTNLTTNPLPPHLEPLFPPTPSSEPPPEAPLAHRPRDCAATARSGGQ